MDLFQPPPLYPPLITRPLNLEKNDLFESLVDIKRNFSNLMKGSFYFFDSNTNSDKTDFNSTIERYSDRYSKSRKVDLNKWKTDWKLLPKELKYFYEKEDKLIKKKRQKTVVSPNLQKKKVKKENNLDIDKLVEIISRDDEIDDNEENEEEEKVKTKEKEEDDENQEDLENLDEEDIEEENDYIDTYFDNGENYGDDDMGGGDEDEGPVY